MQTRWNWDFDKGMDLVVNSTRGFPLVLSFFFKAGGYMEGGRQNFPL